MDLVTIKQYAEDQGISYEAVRKQVVRYSDELSGHIVKRDRRQFLDQWAVDFLTEKRRQSPVVVVSMDRSEENERLREEIDSLRVKLMTAQNELLSEKDRVIQLQDEAKKMIEDQSRYTALLEDNKAKEEKLREAENREADLSRQIETIQTEAEDLRRQAEENQKTIEDLQKERDEAQAEAKSFTKSIFGFYRKL